MMHSARIELQKQVQDVDGLLTDVSVGRQVWGVNQANEIFRRDGTSWTKLPGLLTVISAADDGTVYGRNSADNIFRWENNSWQAVPGLVREISVGSAQHVWGICKDGNIYRFNVPTNSWAQVPCPHRLSDLSVGSDGIVYVVDVNQQIYKYDTNGTWFHLPGLLVSISVADGHNIFGCNAQGEVFRLTPPTTWQKLGEFTAPVRRLSVGSLGLWALGPDHRIRKVDAISAPAAPAHAAHGPVQLLKQPAQDVDGLLIDVSVGRQVWGVNAANEIFRRDGQTWTKIPGLLKVVSSADDGTVYGCNANDQIYRWDNGNWREMPGLVREISCGSSQHVWGICKAGNIYQFNVGANAWAQIPASVKMSDVGVGADGTVYAVDVNQQIYKYENGAWNGVPGLLVSISVSDRDNIVGCNAQGEVWRLTPPSSWSKLGEFSGQVKRVSIGNSGVWAVGADQRIKRLDALQPGMPAPQAPTMAPQPTPQPAQPAQPAAAAPGQLQLAAAAQDVDGLLTDVSVGAHIWGVNAAHQIFRRDGNTWTNIPGLLTRVSAGMDHSVVGCNATHNIYRFAGDHWTEMPGLVRDISTSLLPYVWGVSKENQVFQFDMATNGWKHVHCPHQVADISVGIDGTVYITTQQQAVFKYDAPNWTLIPGALTVISVHDKNNIVGCNAQGQVWRLTPPQAWTQVNQVAGFHVKRLSLGAQGLWMVDANQRIKKIDIVHQPQVQVQTPQPAAQPQMPQMHAPQQQPQFQQQPNMQPQLQQPNMQPQFQQPMMPGMMMPGMMQPGMMMPGMMPGGPIFTPGVVGAQMMPGAPMMGGPMMGGPMMGGPMMPGAPMMGGSMMMPGGPVGMPGGVPHAPMMGAPSAPAFHPVECPKCKGKGYMGTFGPCTQADMHVKGPCPCCKAQCKTTSTIKCQACDGKGALGTFGPCEVFPRDMHYKMDCLACHGSCFVQQPQQKCAQCQGKGGQGTFGACTLTDMHFKQKCNGCAGRGYF